MAAQQQISGGPMFGGDAVPDAALASTASPKRVPLRRGGWAHGAAISKSIVPLRSLARTTAQACGVHRCSLFAWCEGYLLPVMSQFASGERREHLWRAFLGLGMYRITEIPAFARALTERHPVIVRDTRDERGLPAQWATAFGAASCLVLPLLRDDVIVGVAILDNGLADITREQVRRTRGLGAYLASVIDSALSLTELRSGVAPAETPFSAGRPEAPATELQDTIRRVTRLYARAAEVALYAERVRVDNLLHDTLRQTLFAIGFRIESALRGPRSPSALRTFIRALKQDVALMMMQVNQVIPNGGSPAHAPWAELAELEAKIGFGLRDELEGLPDTVVGSADGERSA